MTSIKNTVWFAFFCYFYYSQPLFAMRCNYAQTSFQVFSNVQNSTINPPTRTLFQPVDLLSVMVDGKIVFSTHPAFIPFQQDKQSSHVVLTLMGFISYVELHSSLNLDITFNVRDDWKKVLLGLKSDKLSFFTIMQDKINKIRASTVSDSRDLLLWSLDRLDYDHGSMGLPPVLTYSAFHDGFIKDNSRNYWGLETRLYEELIIDIFSLSGKENFQNNLQKINSLIFNMTGSGFSTTSRFQSINDAEINLFATLEAYRFAKINNFHPTELLQLETEIGVLEDEFFRKFWGGFYYVLSNLLTTNDFIEIIGGVNRNLGIAFIDSGAIFRPEFSVGSAPTLPIPKSQEEFYQRLEWFSKEMKQTNLNSIFYQNDRRLNYKLISQPISTANESSTNEINITIEYSGPDTISNIQVTGNNSISLKLEDGILYYKMGDKSGPVKFMDRWTARYVLGRNYDFNYLIIDHQLYKVKI